MVMEFIFAILGFVLGIYGLFYGFNMYKRYQLIRDTPTSNVSSMSLGSVELKGTVKHPDDEEHIYNHPFVDTDCVYYMRHVEKYNPDDDGADWDTVLRESKGDEFYLEDDTGKVKVKIEDPDFDLEDEARKREKYRVGADDEVPRALRGTSAGSDSILPDVLQGSEKYRVTVEFLWEGMDLYLYGYARSRDGDESFSKNEQNLVVGNAAESQTTESITTGLPLLGKSNPFIIANQNEDELISERKWLGPTSFFVGLAVSAGCLYWLLLLLGVQ